MNEIKHRLRENKILVAIPTYNNPFTLCSVISDVLKYSDDVLVINDGSTDNQTIEIINSFAIQSISYTQNRGKGYALQQALKYANNKGFNYIITIDADGQHFANDIIKFVDKIDQSPGSLIIGARNLRTENMPSKNSFANRFSNFWYYVETSNKLEDTQSGYRLYPTKNLANKHYFSSRYEFEVEVIVRAAWSGINVCNIPIQVYYPPAEERVSHFKPLKDFSRISIVNTVLFILALLYYYPLKFIKACNPSNIIRLIRENITHTKDSNHKIASAIGLGCFFGIFPIWGYQMIIAATIAHILKLNKAITLLSSNISIPPMIPFILYGSYWVGGVVIGSERKLDLSEIAFEQVYKDMIQYLIGATIFSILCGLTAYIISRLVLIVFRKEKANV